MAFNALLPIETDGSQNNTYYGMRPDGTPKGSGYLGELKRPDGGVMTEYSIGVTIKGKDMDVPTIVPTLSEDEKKVLLSSQPGDKIPDSIVQKAVDHANSRLSQGKSVWANTPQTITSSAGATGPAQVMPGTGPEAAKLAGLPWDENQFKYDPAYNKALGMAYFQEQFKQNGNDLAKAYAAYNAGPGALSAAVKKADKEGGNWLSYLPQETQNYVPAAMANYNKAASKPKPEMTMAGVEPLLASQNLSPERLKIARNEAEYHVKNYNAQIKQQGDQGLARVIDYMDKNKVTFNQVPEQIRSAVPSDKISSAIGVGNNLLENKTNLALYNILAADPTKDPATGKPMSDESFMRFRAELSESDFKHYSNERAKKNNAAPGANGPGDLNTGAINRSLEHSLNQLGIDPSPINTGSSKAIANAARVGAIRQFVDTYFYAEQREAGKKFTDAEVNERLNALFMKNQTIKDWAIKDWSFTTGYSGPMLGMQASDLPERTLEEITGKLKQSGNGSPTDAQIIEQYWLARVKR
jgi:soluble lytic murein transglycosylase